MIECACPNVPTAKYERDGPSAEGVADAVSEVTDKNLTARRGPLPRQLGRLLFFELQARAHRCAGEPA